MLCLDVNVLLYAHRSAFDGHEAVRSALERRLDDTEAVSVPDVVASGFLRIATNPRFSDRPSTTAEAWGFIEAILDTRAGRLIRPGEHHWSHFRRMCSSLDASGDLVPDAFIAAYAVERGATLVSGDRGLRVFDDLRLMTPDEL